MTAVLVLLMAVQATLGLAMPTLYRDAEWIKATWFGNDWITQTKFAADPADPNVIVAKVALESYLRLFHRLHGLEYTILRPANPYGERQDPRGPLGFPRAETAV